MLGGGERVVLQGSRDPPAYPSTDSSEVPGFSDNYLPNTALLNLSVLKDQNNDALYTEVSTQHWTGAPLGADTPRRHREKNIRSHEEQQCKRRLALPGKSVAVMPS